MQLEDYFDVISPDEIRIKGHRINIEQIVRRFHNGYAPEEMMQDFPGLSLEKIYGVIAYYLHNKAEVDAYMKRLDEHAEEQASATRADPSSISRRIHALLREQEQHLLHGKA